MPRRRLAGPKILPVRCRTAAWSSCRGRDMASQRSGCGQQIAAAFVHDPGQSFGHQKPPVPVSLPQLTFITRQEWDPVTAGSLPPRGCIELSSAAPLAQAVTGLMWRCRWPSCCQSLARCCGWVRRKEQTQERLARLARWLATVDAVIGLGVIAGLAVRIDPGASARAAVPREMGVLAPIWLGVRADAGAWAGEHWR